MQPLPSTQRIPRPLTEDERKRVGPRHATPEDLDALAQAFAKPVRENGQDGVVAKPPRRSKNGWTA